METTTDDGGEGGKRICAATPRFLLLLMIMANVNAVLAQNTTDPAEARVINEMLSAWGIQESLVTNEGWNISGELCSGAAVDSTDFDSGEYNPAIKCDCNFPNSTCHITRLKVYAMNAVGPIPEGLWTLTYLTNLNVAQNYLTGPLSPSVGNLIRMQWMTIGINALSGEIPPELGRLTDLRSLAFGTNNFNGSLPSELGNLRRLQQLYIDSAGVSGEIPPTFANLSSLVIVWGSDNNFTGRIPDFIGNWTQLQSLRFEGNSFEGSIPPSFSRLTALQDLRITGLRNGTLDFITTLKSLTVLLLRNNRITGSIPSDIGEYQNLTRLDLSFNNLSGPIPPALFNLSQLSVLFLGNNSLNGTLPDVKSTSLSNIDLSYNELSGTLPSWVNASSLQLNLVVNNFTLEGSETSGIPTGLNCLRRDFPCDRGSPRYSSFGINCGGPQITSSSRLVHEQDNEALGPATYYLTPERRWGVSNVGQRDNPAYTASTQRQFTNTLDSELFQTARLSAGSLRYYGLGLENGNYTVNLQFAELLIEDGPTWKSTGRRVFDIYMQGNLVFPDFDIKRAAGGASFSPVSRQATVQVLNNYLEVHLFWSGKGTCCVPNQGTFGPLISAISATPNFTPTVSNNPPSTKKKNNAGLIAGIIVPIAVVSFLALLALYIIRQRRKKQDTFDDYEEFLGIDARPNTFSYAVLRTATDDFSAANKLGEGGFGPVYKGTLDDGRVIAVKQLSIASHQGKSQFMAEIATISAVQHRNLVKLYGCCIDGEKRLLVYEHLENKSLDQALFGKKKLSLSWSTRFDICLGVARGLSYLHEESRIRVVHRDVKASNVLLDSELNPKISDFGLAKLYDDKQTHMSTRVAGTIGYLAPEYAMRGHLTEKADVFGFGVVALEIISGRPNCDSSLDDDKIYLLEFVKLRTATDGFSAANKLGEGGFGPVYKGTLDDGRVIAVKRLSIASHQGKSHVLMEYLGVYDAGKKKLSLSWSTRFDICFGVARGLAYLHEESRIRVVHRDVKASNVLLDSELNPKISDFGLAKLYDDKQTHMSTRVAGTIGYLAPEYAMRGHLTEKADVFGFGVVALEIISGRPNCDSSLDDEKIYLLEWAWDLHEDNNELELVDEALSEFDENEVLRVMRVALLCTQTSPMQRPSMSRVVAMLSGDIEASGAITRPEYLTGFKFNDATTFISAPPPSSSDSGPGTNQSIVSQNTASRPILHDIIGEGR
nr:probable LRR receptor-like serine/threonine-protein kinase At1g56140 [Tanacetum cinerariifolium]